MRVSTASAARQVDRWKQAVAVRYTRFVGSLYFLLIAVGYRKKLLVPVLLLVGMSIQFGVLQLASLTVLGSLVVRLHSYRLANLILQALS